MILNPAAVQGFFIPGVRYLSGVYTLGKTSKKELSKIHPVLQELVYLSISGSPVDFGILKLGGLRTAEEQHQLYLQGYSRADGYKKLSRHQSGDAVDLVPYIRGEYTWDDLKAFQIVKNRVFQVWKEMDHQGYELIWGGSWKFRDYPHYELRKYLHSLKKL